MTHSGEDHAVVYWSVNATDNSGTVIQIGESHTPGSSFPIGTTTVQYNFTDPSSNYEIYSFSITIIGK
jgi:hypothetical protein